VLSTAVLALLVANFTMAQAPDPTASVEGRFVFVKRTQIENVIQSLAKASGLGAVNGESLQKNVIVLPKNADEWLDDFIKTGEKSGLFKPGAASKGKPESGGASSFSYGVQIPVMVDMGPNVDAVRFVGISGKLRVTPQMVGSNAIKLNVLFDGSLPDSDAFRPGRRILPEDAVRETVTQRIDVAAVVPTGGTMVIRGLQDVPLPESLEVQFWLTRR
jgi:hypothetical protein